MSKSVLIVLLAAACSDYEINPQRDKALPGDDPAVDSAEPVDSGEPADTSSFEDSGTTTPDMQAPVAVCDVSPNPVQPPFETATWDGSGSYDPEGGTITTYTWTLVEQPEGSAVTMPSGTGPKRTDFMPDLAGDYVGQLVVQTNDGRTSEPCEVTLESIPAQDLWVEMYWTHDNDDMDLHLLRGSGSFTSNQDCYFANCVPPARLDWGSSSTSDDPRLDLDDIPGTGPENINIDAPEDTTYTVVVHDYPWTGTYSGGNDVTVNIYLNGSLVWSDTRTISGEDTQTYFAEIDWATGTVTSL